MVHIMVEEKIRVHGEVVLAEVRYLMMLGDCKLLARLESKNHELNAKLARHGRDRYGSRRTATQAGGLTDDNHETRQEVRDACSSVAEGI
jgi:hypothetical protein